MYTVILSSLDWNECTRQYKSKAGAIKSAENAVKKGVVYLNPDMELSKKDRLFIVERAYILDDNGKTIKEII